MSGSRTFFLAVGVAVFLTACQRRDPPDERTPYLLAGDAEWSFATSPALALTPTDLRDLTVKALQNSGRFVPSSDDARSPLIARAFAEILSADVTAGADNLSTVDVRVRFQLVPPLSDDPNGISVVASGSAKGATNDASRSAVLSAMGRALEQVAATQRGQTLSNAELVTELNSTEPARVDAALSRLAGRRNPTCFGPLVTRLRSPDVDVAQQAVAYLVSLNDVRAVRPIIDEAEQRGVAFRIEALYALGSLGGDDAEAYLFTLTSSPDTRIRTVATEALTLAKRRNNARTHPAEPLR